MIMDADMLRLNTFANDEECKSAVSLELIAGAPLDIADQYDTIKDRAWIYQNEELLALNKKEIFILPIVNGYQQSGQYHLDWKRSNRRDHSFRI